MVDLEDEMTSGSGCDDILLFLPTRRNRNERHGGRGTGIAELNDYLLVALLATYTDNAMVLLDPPPSASSLANEEEAQISTESSWFDGSCPLEHSQLLKENEEEEEEGNDSSASTTTSTSPPTGLSSLIQHPKWLSCNCPIPCQQTYSFKKWNNLDDQHIQQITCQNDNDRKSDVLVLNGNNARMLFQTHYKDQMIQRTHPIVSPKVLYKWALYLGAKGHEAHTFAYELQKEEDVWDYVATLMARSGLIRFTL